MNSTSAISWFSIIIMCIIPVVAGVPSVSISPVQVSPGELIEVQMTDVPNGSNIDINIDATIKSQESTNINYSVNNLTFDYDLDPAELASSIQGLSDDDPCKLHIKEADQPYVPGGEVTRVGYPTNGSFEIFAMQAIEPLSYESYFLGTAAEEEVQISLDLKGRKTTGTDHPLTTFNFNGFNSGFCTIQLYVDNNLVKEETIKVQGE